MTAEVDTLSTELPRGPALDEPPGAPVPRRALVRRSLRILSFGLIGILVAAMTGWAALAILFADTHAGPRSVLSLSFVIVTVAILVFVRPRRRLALAVVTLFLVVLAWFVLLKPSNSRDWAAEVAQLPWSSVDGDTLAIRNVRDFDYRSENDFTAKWSDRTYDLAKLRTADLMLVYWGSKAIAHAMVSFGFEDGQYLAISVETRKERSESYSALQGFFRQYELYYVFASERDVVRLRTHHRGEDVYLYRTTLTPAQARGALLSYVKRANSLKDRPEFYNALTSNCATNVLEHAREGKLPAELSWEILLSGYAARQAYRNGRLDTSMPFDELEARSRINDTAMAVDSNADFSRAIRAGLPDPKLPTR